VSTPVKRARAWIWSTLGLDVLTATVLSVAVHGPGARIAVVFLGVVACIVTIALFKGRGKLLLGGVVGLAAWGLGSLLILTAATRLAKPESMWAKAFYGPRKRSLATIRYAPTQCWSKLCARCGHPFTTTVPSVVLCDVCRGGFPFGITPADALGLGLGVGLVSAIFNNPHQH
jgi:hypothetical protein